MATEPLGKKDDRILQLHGVAPEVLPELVENGTMSAMGALGLLDKMEYVEALAMKGKRVGDTPDAGVLERVRERHTELRRRLIDAAADKHAKESNPADEVEILVCKFRLGKASARNILHLLDKLGLDKKTENPADAERIRRARGFLEDEAAKENARAVLRADRRKRIEKRNPDPTHLKRLRI